MGEIQAEVRRGLSDFLFHIGGLAKNFFDNLVQFCFDFMRLDISEESWEGLLKQLQD